MTTEFKESVWVTVLSVIGFVFGIICLLSTFIPFFGKNSFYIGAPALLISGISYLVAIKLKSRITFPVVAITINMIGLSICLLNNILLDKALDRQSVVNDSPLIQEQHTYKQSNKDNQENIRIYVPSKK